MLRNVDEIRAGKSETGGDTVTTGSIRLVREPIATGPVDEYRLFTHPVVLGRGQEREHRTIHRYASNTSPTRSVRGDSTRAPAAA